MTEQELIQRTEQEQSYLPGFLDKQGLLVKEEIQNKLSTLKKKRNLSKFDLLWIYRLDYFFSRSNYLTNRQVEVLNSLCEKNGLLTRSDSGKF